MFGRSMAGRIYQQRPFKPAKVNLRHNPQKQRVLEYPIPGDSSFQPELGRKHYNPRGSVIHDLIFNEDYEQMNRLKQEFQNQYGSLDKRKNENYLQHNNTNQYYSPHKNKGPHLNFQNSIINESYQGGKQFNQLSQNTSKNINKSQASSNNSQYDNLNYYSPMKNSRIVRQESMNQILKPYQPVKDRNISNYGLERNNSFNYNFKDQIDEIKIKSINPSFLSGF